MKQILFVNHKQKQCGVYQYGLRLSNILKQSKNYNLHYCEVESGEEFFNNYGNDNFQIVVFNWHISTLPWLNSEIIKSLSAHCIGIHHEGNPPSHIQFDDLIVLDKIEFGEIFPRPLFEKIDIKYIEPSIPTIGSFGFGFYNKGFDRLCRIVNEQFDEAIIRLRIPFAHYGDSNGNLAMSVAQLCQSQITKPGIKLDISHDFLSDEELLNFLASNTLNMFVYDDMFGRGFSSAIDYALSVKKPIAISKSFMFRHISDVFPSINVEQSSLQEIINNGSSTLDEFREKWSNINLIKTFEEII